MDGKNILANKLSSNISEYFFQIWDQTTLPKDVRNTVKFIYEKQVKQISNSWPDNDFTNYLFNWTGGSIMKIPMYMITILIGAAIGLAICKLLP